MVARRATKISVKKAAKKPSPKRTKKVTKKSTSKRKSPKKRLSVRKSPKKRLSVRKSPKKRLSGRKSPKKGAKSPRKVGPKRPTNAFMHYAKANRKSVIRKHGLDSKKVTHVARALGENWKKLSEAEKKPYLKKASQDLNRYRAAVKRNPPPRVPRKKKKTAAKDPAAPKRPKNAYMFFANQNRETVMKRIGAKPKDIHKVAKALGKEWNKMTPEQKKPYEYMATRDSSRYKSAKGGNCVIM